MQHGPRSILPEGGKARRVYLQLRADILSGGRGPDSRLPGEERMARDFGVSRVTIRRALDALSADGLVERRAGSGTRVRRGVEPRRMGANVTTLIPQIVAMGQHSARLLSFSYDVPPAPVSRAMGVAENVRMQRAVRVRLAEDTPFSHLTTYVPEDIASNYSEADLASMPLYQLLERSGVAVAAAQQSVTATLAAPDVADALGVATGSALLSLRRVVRDDGGRAVEYLAALYRPDRFQLEMDLARVGEGAARHWQPVVGAPGEGA